MKQASQCRPSAHAVILKTLKCFHGKILVVDGDNDEKKISLAGFCNLRIEAGFINAL